MEVRIQFLVIALALWHCDSASISHTNDPYCLANDTDPYNKFASKTPYDFGRGSFTEEALVPAGCEAVQAFHLVRHGTRYPSDDDVIAFIEELPRLQAAIIDAHSQGKGELCDADVTNLKDWDLGGLNITWESKLAPEGEMEMFELAQRYKAALPALLDKPFSNETFKFRHTEKQRTQASARAYAKGLFGEAGETIYMPEPLDPDPILKFYELCSKYIIEVDDNPEAVIEKTLFEQGPEMMAVLEEVSTRVGFEVTFDDVSVMYDACRYYKAFDPPLLSAWCATLTPDNLQIMEYWQDLKYYYEDGYGHKINYEQACPPLKDLIQHFKYVIANGTAPSGILYFTHSSATNKIISRLGLFEDDSPLMHDYINPDRLWRTSHHTIFATNLAFTLSNCGEEKGWWVSVMMSEIPLQLPGCPSEEGCSWDDFLLNYGQYEQCDFDAICENEEFKPTEPPAGEDTSKSTWSSIKQKAAELWRDFSSFLTKTFS